MLCGSSRRRGPPGRRLRERRAAARPRPRRRLPRRPRTARRPGRLRRLRRPHQVRVVSVVGKLWSGSLTGLAPCLRQHERARPPCVWHKRFVAARYAGSSRAAPWLTLRSAAMCRTAALPHRSGIEPKCVQA